jgi:hypothetical protein
MVSSGIMFIQSFMNIDCQVSTDMIISIVEFQRKDPVPLVCQQRFIYSGNWQKLISNMLRRKSNVLSQKYMCLLFLMCKVWLYLSKTSPRVCHTFGRQSYRTKVLCVQPHPWYGNLGSHHMLKTESSNFRIIMM